MKRVPLKIDLRNGRHFDTFGFVPFADCPIAVTRPIVMDVRSPTGVRQKEGDWCLTHLPSGRMLGNRRFAKRETAMAFIERCEPRNPAWQVKADAPKDERQACLDLYCKAALRE